MIKIFTDKSYINEGNRKIVFPLLFDLLYHHNPDLLEKYNVVNTLLEADIAVVPVDISYYFQTGQKNQLFNFIDGANLLHKKVWVYSAGDFGITLNKNVYTFRLGGFESKFDEKTFIMPSFISDPYNEIDSKFVPIVKTKIPKIGFVGHADSSLIKIAREFYIYGLHSAKRFCKKLYTDYQAYYPSGIIRYNLLTNLKSSNFIDCDFIFRDKYRAGASSEAAKKETAEVFFDNIYQNPYTFCIRGAGNFSVRFYETLAMGRIPLLVDTDFRLPLHNSVLWKNHCIIVPENNIEKGLIDFHKNITENQFLQLQINNRNLWLNYLERKAYFIAVYKIFK